MLAEISDGNPAEAAKRMDAVNGMAVVGVEGKVRELALDYLKGMSLPAGAESDALHLALARHGTGRTTS